MQYYKKNIIFANNSQIMWSQAPEDTENLLDVGYRACDLAKKIVWNLP